MSVILVTLAVTVITWFAINYVYYKYKVDKMMRKVDFLRGGLPLVGHTFYLAGKEFGTPQEMFNLMSEETDKLERDKRFWVMNLPFLIPVQLNTIEKVLSSHDAVEKSYLNRCFESVMNGLFTAPTHEWRKIRKPFTTMFNPKFFPHFIDQMNYQVKVFLDKVPAAGLLDDYQNVLPLVVRYFFDVVSCTHLGVNTKQQGRLEDSVSDEVSRGSELVFKRICKPWLHPDFTFFRSKLYQEVTACLDKYKHFLAKVPVVSEKYQKNVDQLGNKLGWKSYAVISRELLEEMGKDSDPETVGRFMVDLFVGGSDTSGVTLSTLLYHLGNHPEYQDLAYLEIMEVYHDGTEVRVPEGPHISAGEDDWQYAQFFPQGYSHWTKSKLERLDYCEMLIKETLRLCSPPAISRCTLADIDVGDYIIPKGTSICIFVRNVHRSAKYYQKPDQFYPEHFSKENVKNRPKTAFLGFSKGPRDCPGKTYAMYVIKCLLAEIIRNYKIVSRPTDKPMGYKLLLMVEQAGGYPVKFIPRNGASETLV